MKTKLWAVGLVVLCTFLISFAQLFYKLGSNVLSFNILDLLTNHYLILGLLLYGVGAILLVIALRGGELSVLYPIVATSYIWVFLLSVYFFDEIVSFSKLFGIGFVILGVILVGGSK